jgi:hypothetical protein
MLPGAAAIRGTKIDEQQQPQPYDPAIFQRLQAEQDERAGK